MNAYLMAAGLATRLRPLTKKYPKCLFKVYGVEMLDFWITACLQTELFENVYVNVHHCPSVVLAWLEKYKKKAGKIFGDKSIRSIKIIDETSKLLGTAGTLFWHGDVTDDFFLVYVDTFSREMIHNLRKICSAWIDNPDNPIAGLVTFNLPDDGSAGAIETDFIGTVKSFKEKDGDGLVGWAGMMLARGDFIKEIGIKDKDLAKDVFPKLCGRMRVISHVDAYDIGRGVDEYERFNSKI